MDVVPVVPIEDEDTVLHIPDRKVKEWIYTHPKAHMEAATRINAECSGRYIPLVKIVKAWYRYQAKEKRELERPKPKGFTLEALVAQYQDPDATTYAEAYVGFLQNLLNSCGALLKAGVFPDVPDPGAPGEFLKLTIEQDDATLFAEIVEESLAVGKKAFVAETVGESALLWREVFGSGFPEAPASAQFARAAQLLEHDTLLDSSFESEVCRSTEFVPSIPNETVTITAQLAREKDGTFLRHHSSDSRPIAKEMGIKFSISKTSVEPPYEIRWIVENHGKEAQEAKCMDHEASSTSNEPWNWETTAYCGSHFLICEVIKGGAVVARTKHIVNIK